MSKKDINRAGSVFLDLTGIKFILLPYWNIINVEQTRVDDIMYPLIPDEKSLYSPNYAVKGKYAGLYKGQKKIFYIDTTGPHILFLTEVPKNENLDRYHLDNTLERVYWEDNIRGYLFQIVDTTKKTTKNL